jgi:predicted secreted protein
MVGSGGTFLFRYEAIDVGPQSFRFVHHCPWESVEPAQVIEFDATVY